MRACLVLLAACGRLGFDSAGGDASAIQTADLCDARTIGTLPFNGETATNVRAVALPSGYAVGVGTSANNIYIARIAADLSLTSTHVPLQTTYTLGGISALGDSVFVHSINSGTAYLKLLDASWNAYTTVEDGDNAAADPPLAPASASLGMRVRIIGGLAKVGEIRADGTTGILNDYFPTAVFASLAPSGDSARVAIETPTGTCETYLVAPTGVTSARHPITPCGRPHAITLPTGATVIAYELGNTTTVYFLPSDGQGNGSSLAITGATNARIAAIDGVAWLLYEQAGVVEIRRIDDAMGVTTSTVPITAPFELLPKAAFWVEGQTLRVAKPCLR